MTGQDQHTAGRYVREDGEDRQAVPVCRLQGLAEAPRALLVVDQLNLQGKRDAALREGLKKIKKSVEFFLKHVNMQHVSDHLEAQKMIKKSVENRPVLAPPAR